METSKSAQNQTKHYYFKMLVLRKAIYKGHRNSKIIKLIYKVLQCYQTVIEKKNNKQVIKYISR